MKAYAYGSSANLGPGFDVLGVAIKPFRDVVEVELAGEDVLVVEARGPYKVPLGKDNVAVAAVKRALELAEHRGGARIRIWKGVPPGMGLGSSGASSAAAVRAVNAALGEVLTEGEMIEAASRGEELASGSPHMDNVAPSLLGGFVLISEEVRKFEADVQLLLAIPWVKLAERKTELMRRVLPREVSLEEAVRHYSHLAMLITGLLTGDLELAGRGMSFSLVDEARSPYVPAYRELKSLCPEKAYGCSISGAGPTMIFLCEDCPSLVEEVREIYRSKGVPATLLVTEPAGPADLTE